jgi:phage baseplate assembly protein V
MRPGPWQQAKKVPFRVGLVTEVQVSPFPAARVKFPDRDDLVSYWLPIALPGTQDDKSFWVPDLGEMVTVLMDENDENGAILGSLGSLADTAPGWATTNRRGIQFSDGTTLYYDRSSHTLYIELVSGGTLNCSTSLGNSIVLNSDGSVQITDQSGSQVSLNNDGTVVISNPSKGTPVNLHVTGTITTG